MKNIGEDVKIKGSGGIMDSIDDMIKQSYNITDELYDYIAEKTSDEDLKIFLDGLGGFNNPSTFSEKRASLEIRNKYLAMYQNERGSNLYK